MRKKIKDLYPVKSRGYLKSPRDRPQLFGEYRLVVNQVHTNGVAHHVVL